MSNPLYSRASLMLSKRSEYEEDHVGLIQAHDMGKSIEGENQTSSLRVGKQANLLLVITLTLNLY